MKRAVSADRAPIRLQNRFGIVVIGRNEGSRLEKCLHVAIRSALVVYVDSGSNDGSASAARAAGADVVELNTAIPFTAARARNDGFSRLLELSADLSYVQFVDGDCEMIPGWTDAGVRFLDDHPDTAIVCGQRIERHPEASIFNKMCNHEWDTPVGVTMSCGGDAMVRVDAFRAVGGFRNELIAHEEPELCSRLRSRSFKIWRLDHPMTLHDAAITRTSQFYQRSRRAGVGITQYLVRTDRRDRGDGSDVVIRGVIWGALIPVATLVSVSAFGPCALFLLLLYPAQIIRYALLLGRTDYSLGEAFKVAVLSMLGKFAAAHGAIEFLVRTFLGKAPKSVLYR